MNNEITYKQVNKKQFQKCFKLISKFKKNINLNKKLLKWEYFLNPFGKAKIFVAEYKNNFVGMIICIPLKFKKNKKIYNGFRIQDVITEINFRRMGIFTTLLNLSDKYVNQESNVNITLPNENSLPFFKKNNWREICNIPLIAKTTNNKSNFLLKYNLIKKFTKTHENIWSKSIKNKFDIFWSTDFSNWRYCLNPKSKYVIFEIKNNTKIIGYMVLKKYKLESKKKMIGHICQLVCADSYIEDSIKFASNYFFNSSIKNFSMWKIRNVSLFINKLGFKKINLKNKKFFCKGKKIFSKSSLNLSMSYSDIY